MQKLYPYHGNLKKKIWISHIYIRLTFTVEKQNVQYPHPCSAQNIIYLMAFEHGNISITEKTKP